MITRNRELGIQFWMQECDHKGQPLPGSQAIDLEVHPPFEGLAYSSASGLLDKGKVKNTYRESYADSDRERVYFPIPTTENPGLRPAREATSVTFIFYFVGENRRQSYDNFYEYLTGGFRSFWDTKRRKRLVFYAPNEYKVGEEMWYGSTPFLRLELAVQNVFGDTFDVAL